MKLHAESLEARTLLTAEVRAVAIPSDLAMQNRAFVSWMSANLVDKPLSKAFQARLVSQLDRHGSRTAAVLAVLRSPLGRRAQIVSIYQSLLDREPTSRELGAWLALGAKSFDQSALIRRVASSNEYYRVRGRGTPLGFIQAVWSDLLGLAPNQAETDQYLGLLKSGQSRRRVVATFMKSSTYINSASQEIVGAGLKGGSDPGLVSAVAADLASKRAQPLTSAKATLFGSDDFLPTILNPTTPPVVTPGSASAPAVLAVPLTPGFSLNTNWTSITPSGVSLINANSFGASPGGTLWFGTTATGLIVYNPVTLATSTAWSGVATSVAPVSDTQAWVIGSSEIGGSTAIFDVTTQGQATAVTNLPGGATPSQIAASPDGTVWVLSQAGSVYSYVSTSNSWDLIPNQGFNITQISLGSASNIVAIAADHRFTSILDWTTTSGWIADTSFPGSPPSLIAATNDGSVWAYAGRMVYLKPPGGSWYAVPNQTPPGTLLFMVANDRNRMLGISESSEPFGLLSIGVVDRPATAFPDVTSQWAAGYAAINAGLGIAQPYTIRDLYSDSAADLQTFLTELLVGGVPKPDDVTTANWNAIKTEIETELKDVIGVNNLFTQLNNLNLAISAVDGKELTAASNLVGLTEQQQNNNPVSLAIQAMFEAALSGVSSAVSGGASVAASLISSGVDSLIADLTQTPDPGPDTKLTQTEAALYTTLVNLFLDNASNYANEQQQIVKDYGMLSAVGTAVNSGLWFWSDTKGTTLAKAAAVAFDQYFYAALMPIEWQIVYVSDYVSNPYLYPPIAAPNYDVYVQVISGGDNTALEDVWFVNQLGASTNPTQNSGPFPTQALLNAIFATGIDRSAFFQDQVGWNMTLVLG